MNITDKITGICKDMGLAVVRGTAEQLGVLVDTVTPPIAAVLDYGTSTQEAHGCQRVERVSMCVFFLERSTPTFSPTETLALYERCKAMADDFVNRVQGNDSPDYSTLRLQGSPRYERVNLRYKGIYGGIMVTADITDLRGFAAPTTDFENI